MTGAEAVPILELASVTIIRMSDLRFRFIYVVSLSRYSVQTTFGTLPTGAYSDTRKTQTPLL